VIGIPVILWAVAHWGFYYFIKLKLDHEILQAAPHAVIRYQDLSTSLSGKINVESITVIPTGMEQSISISAVHVIGPDALSYLMDQIPGLGSGKGIPKRLVIAARQIQLDISGDKAQQLDRIVAADNPQLVQQRDICRPGNGSSFVQLQELGFEHVSGDMKASYHFQPGLRKLYADFNVDVKDMQRLELSLILDNVSALSAETMMGVLLEQFKISFDYIPEFGRQTVAYCADKRGLEPKQFQLLMVDDFMMELREKGIVPGIGLTSALKEYLTNWGNLTIDIRPAQPMNMFALMAVSRAGEKIPDKLGMQLVVNGRLITDLSFQIRENSPFTGSDGASANEKKAPPRPEYVWEYHKVAVGNLSGYLDHKVIVVERGGRTHEGVLVEVKGGRVSIQKRISGGKFTAHILQSSVVSAKVEVKVKVPPKRSAS
jgi:hypothetical protein